jgi:hypothetical protein
MSSFYLHNKLGNNNLTLFPSWRRDIRHLVSAKSVFHAWEISGQARNDGKRLGLVSLESLNTH